MMFEIFIHSATAIIIAFIGIFSSKILFSIKNDVELIKDHLNADKTLADYKRKLNEMNAHYVDMFANSDFRRIANCKGNAFVTVIEHILDTYDINIGHFREIKGELDNGKHKVYESIKGLMGVEFADMYYEKHRANYYLYLEDVEIILSDTRNHYPERFVKASTDFLRMFMHHLKDLEKQQCQN